MLIIEYNSNDGCHWPDGKIMDAVRCDWASAERAGLQGNTYTRTVASALYITALRLLVANGTIDPNLVKFIYIRSRDDLIELTVDRRGYLDYWPEGFCDTDEKMLLELLGWRN